MRRSNRGGADAAHQLGCLAVILALWSTSVLTARVEPSETERIRMEQVIKDIPYKDEEGGAWRQGWEIKMSDYESTKKKHTPDSSVPLQVFVLPHSHNDPGWLRTYEGYYDLKTRDILNSVTQTLSERPNRHFIWAEISFFSLWWNEIDDSKKDQFKKLLKNGQFEFVTGGWVMNDEATPHYAATINQMTEGHEWLMETFGYKPKAGWSIDPFGYSPTQAYINQLNGLDAMLIQRAHYEIKKYLAQRQSLEFLWHQNFAEDETNDMFTHLMPFYSYDIPHTCGPVPSVCSQFDFTKTHTQWGGSVSDITNQNVKDKSSILLDEYKKKSMLYRSKNVLAPLGDDFLYVSQSDCNRMWTNHEKIQEYIGADKTKGAVVQFSNLSNYFEHVFKSSKSHNIDYPVLSGDFFTYADIHKDYWSGYFTSRPFWKRFGRNLESVMRAADIIFALAKHTVSGKADDDSLNKMRVARRWSALFQHHDGMSGTAKPDVVLDYGEKLKEGKWFSKGLIAAKIGEILTKTGQTAVHLVSDESQIGASDLPALRVLSTDSPQTVVFFNPLTFERKDIVRLRVSSSKVQVNEAGGDKCKIQVNPVFDGAMKVVDGEFELYFQVDVPPFGLKTYFITPSSSEPTPSPKVVLYTPEGSVQDSPKIDYKRLGDEDLTLENSHIQLSLDKNTGLMKSWTSKGSSKKTVLEETFAAYNGLGGAYLFHTDGNEPHQVGENKRVAVIKGDLVNIAVLTQTGPVPRRTIRLYDTEDSLTSGFLDVTIDADIRSETNKELFTRYKTDMKTRQEFYTDMNGYQLQYRKTRNDRPLQHNFYPVTATMMHQDENQRFTVLTEQPMGVGSLEEGEFRIMLDRRLSQDDNRGLQEGVLDNVPVQYQFYLTLEARVGESEGHPDLTDFTHQLYESLNHPFEFVSAPVSESDWHKSMFTCFSPMSHQFPEDLHVVMLRNRGKKETVLQLTRHRYDPAFTVNHQQTGLSVDLHTIFEEIPVEKAAETTLSFLHQKDKVAKGTPLPIETMELRAFVFELGLATERKTISDSAQSQDHPPPAKNKPLKTPDNTPPETPAKNPKKRPIPNDDSFSPVKRPEIDDGAVEPLVPLPPKNNDGGAGSNSNKRSGLEEELINLKEQIRESQRLQEELNAEIEKIQKENQKVKSLGEENEKLREKLRTMSSQTASSRNSMIAVMLLSVLVFGIVSFFGIKRRNLVPIFFGLFLVVNILLPFLFFREAH